MKQRKAIGGPARLVRRSTETAVEFSARVIRILSNDKPAVAVWHETGPLCRNCAMLHHTDGIDAVLHYTEIGCHNCSEK